MSEGRKQRIDREPSDAEVRRILLADDDPLTLRVLGERFRELGHDVDTARNGVETMELARRVRPDVIVLDVVMPELNGFQACRRILADPQLADIPVVLLSARDSEADRFWGAEVGARLYLSKKLGAGEVVRRVRAILHSRD